MTNRPTGSPGSVKRPARQVLALLASLHRAGDRVSPTITEIAGATGLSRSRVHMAIKALDSLALIYRLPHRASAIAISPAGLAFVPEIEFDGCCWVFIPASRLAMRAHGQRSAREPASQ